MATTAAAQEVKKKEKEPDYRQIINEILDLASKSRRGLASNLQEFETAGLESRRGREQQQKMESIPTKPLQNIVVSRSEGKKELSPHMSQLAIEKAVDLGDIIDAAAESNKKLSLGRWVRG